LKLGLEFRDQRAISAAVVAIILLGMAARLWDLGARSLWLDEAGDYWIAAAPLGDILAANRQGSMDPPLYYYFLHFWMRLGRSEFVLRLPSVLCGTAAIFIFYLWVKRLLGIRPALIGALLFALAPVQIYYSQEVNQYALLVLFSTLILLCFERVVTGGKAPWLWGLTFASIAGLYSHYGIFWALLSLNLIFPLVAEREKAEWTKWLLCQGGILLAALCLIPLTLSHQFRLGQGPGSGYLGPYYHHFHHWREELAFLCQRTGELFRFLTTPYRYIKGSNLVFWAILLLGLNRYRSKGAAGRRAFLYLFVPLALVYLASGFNLYPYGHRQMLFITPAYYAALATGLSALKRHNKWAFRGATVLALAIFALSHPGINPDTVLQEDLRPVVAYVREHQKPQDVIYVYYGAHPAFRYYYDGPPEAVIYGTRFRERPLEAKVAEIAEVMRSARRTWLVFSHCWKSECQDILALLVKQYHLAARYEARGASAYLFEPR